VIGLRIELFLCIQKPQKNWEIIGSVERNSVWAGATYPVNFLLLFLPFPLPAIDFGYKPYVF